MWKLYENFHIFHFQKRKVSAETIRGNTVLPVVGFRFSYKMFLGDWAFSVNCNGKKFPEKNAANLLKTKNP